MTTINFRLPVAIDRDQLWSGLRRKITDPTLFLSGVSGCRVIEEFPDGLLREILLGDDLSHTERVVFQPPHRVVIEHITDTALTSITSTIEEDLSGGLYLALLVDGSPERLTRMYDYFGNTFTDMVEALHRDAV
jgi:hypothetical protein